MKKFFTAALVLALSFAAPGAALAAQGDTAEDPIVITTAEQLDAVRNGLDKHYKLGGGIDLADFIKDEKGWLPIGEKDGAFTGSFDGDGHKITGLWMSRWNDAGLFGVAKNASIKNLSVEIADAGVNARFCVGGLVGQLEGSLENCAVTGSVTGSGSQIGVLAGLVKGSVANCRASGSATGSDAIEIGGEVGGLVGRLEGSAADCRAESSVTGNEKVGGLVGIILKGSVINCRAAGDVTGAKSVGGLAGNAFGEVMANCGATGNVTGSGNNVGGLAGSLQEGLTVSNCYASGSVTGSLNYIGGLAGGIRGKVTNCYAAGSVIGDGAESITGVSGYVGGLTGALWFTGEIAGCYAMGQVTSSGKNVGALIGNADGDAKISGCHALPPGELPAKSTYTANGWTFYPETPEGPWHWVEGQYPQLEE